MKNENKKFLSGINIFLIVFFIITLVIPIIRIFSNIKLSQINELINSYQFTEALNNSLVVTFVATIISIVLSYLLAYAINRSNMKFKHFFAIIFVLPMLIPSISHGIGLINLFGTNGIFTKIFNFKFNLFGFNGILLGSILYSFPVAFLIFSNSFKYLDNTLYELSDVLGLNWFQKFKKITFHYMKKSIISAVFAVFTLIFTDYGVPLAVGGKYITLPYYLYREVIGLLNFSTGALIGMFLLVPAIISFFVDNFVKETNVLNYTIKKVKIVKNKTRDSILFVLSLFISGFLFILFASFIYMAFVKKFPYDNSFSFDHLKYIFRNGALNTIINSIVIAIISSIVGTIIAYFSAYLSARRKGLIGKTIHIFSISTLAIPGIVLGLSYVLTFKNTFIYNSLTILILVNIIHFFASPYLLAYNALGKLNDKYEEVGITCGISRFRIIKDVIVPNSIKTIIDMISYFFVNCMITISAVTFLYTSYNMPVSLLINKYEGYLMFEEAAIISLIILIINIIIKFALKLLYNKKGNNNYELQSI